MTYTRKNQGTCSSSTTITIDENGIITDASIAGGCNGNLKGIASLTEGQKAEDIIARLEGLKCGMKPTSCPDQLALALREALEEKAS